MKIFLDDVRVPSDCVSYMHTRIGILNPIYLEDWKIVRNYKEFVDAIYDHHKEITHISFDHDLADIHYDPKKAKTSFEYYPETGLDCAKFMKAFYKSNEMKMPILFVHSMNPVGKNNIIQLFENH